MIGEAGLRFGKTTFSKVIIEVIFLKSFDKMLLAVNGVDVNSETRKWQLTRKDEILNYNNTPKLFCVKFSFVYIMQYHWTNGPQETGLTDTSGVQIFFQDANLRQYDAATTAGRNFYREI